MQDVKDFFVVVELMGRYSNVILLDENDIILDALVRIGVSEKADESSCPARNTPRSPKATRRNFTTRKA